MSNYNQRSQRVKNQLNIGRDLHIHLPAFTAQQQQARKKMIERVRTRWVTGFLHKSLHGSVLLLPSLYELPDAIVNPWRQDMQELAGEAHSLPPDTAIQTVYDDADQQLLILGAPGSGKTTLLLELARELLNRAQQDETHPIPVIFNLTSWTVKRLPLEEWLIEELYEKYQVVRKIGSQWVEEDQILVLLDSLDEIPLEQRAECIEAINTYRREHSWVPSVVCCRYDDYFSQKERLLLQNAVVVQPLNKEQIDYYLASLGNSTLPIRNAVRDNPALQELVAVPLMLNIVTLVYNGQPTDDLLVIQSSEAWRERLFSAYIQRMLHRRSANKIYPEQQTIHWLSWLAQQLTRHSQTELYLERIQPDWLSPTWRSQLLYTLSVRFCAGMLCAVIYELLIGLSSRILPLSSNFLLIAPFFGLLVGLLLKVEDHITPAEIIAWSWKDMRQGLIQISTIGKSLLIWLCISLLAFFIGKYLFLGNNWLIYDLVVAPFSAIFFGLIYKATDELQQDTYLPIEDSSLPIFIKKTAIIRKRLAIGFVFGIFGGLLFGLLTSLFYIGIFQLLQNPPPTTLHLAISYGLFSWVTFGLVGGSLVGFSKPVKTEANFLSILFLLGKGIWQRFINIESLGNGFLFGSLIGLLFPGNGYTFFFFTWLLGTLFFGVFHRLVSGLSSRMQEEHLLLKPNQGIRNSLRNSMLIGGFSALASWLIFGSLFVLVVAAFTIIAFKNKVPTGTLSDMPVVLLGGVLFGVLGGVICGILLALKYGGTAYIQHIVLRFFLWRKNTQPWKYTRFLDYAVDRVFLLKIGGGYIFVHRLLLEHFSSLSEIPVPIVAVQQVQSETYPIRKTLSPIVRVFLAISILIGSIYWLGNVTSAGQTTANAYPPVGWKLAVNGLKPKTSPWIDYYPIDRQVCGFVGNVYQISSALPGQNYYCNANNFNFTDMAFEAEMRIDQGDEGGIVFRVDHDGGNLYRFNIDQNGSYALDRFLGNHETTLVQGSSPIIHTGLHQLNIIAIVAQGNIFNLFINHQFIQTVKDTVVTWNEERIGLTAISPLHPTLVSFLHTHIWVNNQQLPLPSPQGVKMYPPAHWVQILDDPMHASAYPEELANTSPQARCGFVKNSYQITNTFSYNIYHCNIQNIVFSDFVIEAQTRIVKGDAAGLIFHEDRDRSTNYLFAINTTGTYALYLFTHNAPARTLSSAASSAIQTGLNRPNLLAIVAQRQTIKLFINHQLIATVADTTIEQGQVGLGAIDLGNATQVVFDTLKIWEKP